MYVTVYFSLIFTVNLESFRNKQWTIGMRDYEAVYIITIELGA